MSKRPKKKTKSGTRGAGSEKTEVSAEESVASVEVDVIPQEHLPVVSDRGGDLSLYIRDMKRYPVLSREEEKELAKRWYEDADPDAFRKLVVSNLRFVVKIANEYRRYGFRVSDLIQEGNVGLIKAVMKFNPNRGYRLISYAVWWIRAQIHDHILKNWSMVKLGTTQLQRKLFYRLQNAQSVLKERLHEEASDQDRDRLALEHIADSLGTDTRTVQEFQTRMKRRDLSIDTPLSDDNAYSVGDRLAQDGTDQHEVLEVSQSHHMLHDVIDAVRTDLNDRDLYILDNRILSDSPLTLEELGDRYGVSKERIRQVEKRIREKIVKAGKERFQDIKYLASDDEDRS
ncbi:MAG: RNA polymerase subunit sigma-70 [Myxococcales bacterium]|nr:RNA polymerase subunit sigma-70 [Myxococcales bacterium]|tara:strand:+ start:319 stop:1347 length:1029 start_codon:yes stop_codon:yes gene_type:complete